MLHISKLYNHKVSINRNFILKYQTIVLTTPLLHSISSRWAVVHIGFMSSCCFHNSLLQLENILVAPFLHLAWARCILQRLKMQNVILYYVWRASRRGIEGHQGASAPRNTTFKGHQLDTPRLQNTILEGHQAG